ncbi:MAG: hypothetical protein IT319_22175 [Anaerolineae bacterium]|nr:hypothetical protein [Anaerolineae bacterium]
MTDLTTLKQAARIVYDESGNPVVQIPLSVWQEWLAQPEPENFQIHKINALVRAWSEEPDDLPEGWWDNFRQFLKENPPNFETLHDPTDE